jgi:excisionase family DNA binding protein
MAFVAEFFAGKGNARTFTSAHPNETKPRAGTKRKVRGMTYSIKDITDRFGVGEHTVYEWIRRGELRAINVAKRQGTKPKWRITDEALRAFETSRMPSPPPERQQRKRRDDDSISYY